MSSEIERKFLVRELPAELERQPSTEIRQGYVAIEPDGTEVRVRRRGGRPQLTVKARRRAKARRARRSSSPPRPTRTPSTLRPGSVAR